jgi:hypothetical protein
MEMTAALPDGFVLDQPQGLPPGFVLDQEQPGFVSNVATDLGNRINQGGNIINQAMTGTNSIPGAFFDLSGTGAGAVNDVLGEGVKSGMNALSSINPAGMAMMQGNQVASPAIGQAAQGAQNVYSDFSQAYPMAAQHINAGANLAALLPVGKIAGEAKDALFGGKDLAGAMSDADALRQSSGAFYKDSALQNLQVSPENTKTLQSALGALTPKTDMEQRVWSGSAAAKHAQDIQDSLATENPSFNGLLAKRTELNSQIKVASRAGNDAEVEKLGRVKDALDSAMMNGDTQSWQMANHQWAQQAILGDTDELVNGAATKMQPANSLDTALNNYLKSYKSKGLSSDERAALENVTSNTSFDKLRRGAASGLLKFASGAAGAHFGPVGAGAGYLMGHYGSEFMKDAAMTSKLSKLDDFRDMIANRTPPADNSFSSPVIPGMNGQPAQALLPPPGMSPSEIAAAQAQNARGPGPQLPATGGLPQPLAETGPMVNRPDGDVPYNYFAPKPPFGPPAAQFLLRQKMAPVWDQVTGEQREQMADQINQAWKQNDVQKAPVSQKAMAQALLNAMWGQK